MQRTKLGVISTNYIYVTRIVGYVGVINTLEQIVHSDVGSKIIVGNGLLGLLKTFGNSLYTVQTHG